MFGTIILVAGPSGAGKTSLINALLHNRSGVKRGVTVTSRLRRPEEVDNKDYIFVSQEECEEMTAAGSFFETDTVFGESYGIPRDFYKGQGNLVLIVSLAGARAVKRAYPEAKTVLILPASAGRARQRLINREAPNENEQIGSYHAQCEAAWTYDEEIGFDAVVKNNNFEDALRALESFYMRRGKSASHSLQSPHREFPTYISSRLGSLGEAFAS